MSGITCDERMQSVERDICVVAHQYADRFTMDVDDLAQELRMEVFRSIGRYDKTRGATFTTWVRGWIRNRAIDIWRRNTPAGVNGRRESPPTMESLDRPLSSDGTVSLADQVGGGERTDRHVEDSEFWSHLLQMPRIRRLALHSLGYTMREIGEMEGVTESRICQQLKEVRCDPRTATTLSRLGMGKVAT